MNFKEFEKKLEKIKEEGYVYHHAAKARGYQRVDEYYIESYAGKYGEGFVCHYPTKADVFSSNRYHPIVYYT